MGKTQLIKAVASEFRITFMNVQITTIISKWLGESEKAIKCLFDLAKERRPCIIFVDECDGLCRARKEQDSESTAKLATQLLTSMDGFSSADSGVLVIGNTNLPQILDAGFRRRFEQRVYVALPTKPERRQLIQQFLKDYRHSVSESQIKDIARKTDG